MSNVEGGGIRPSAGIPVAVSSGENERNWYTAEMFWGQIEESKGRSAKGTLVAQFNRFLGEVRGEVSKTERDLFLERRIGELLLRERGESLTRAIPEGDFVEAVKKDVRWLQPFWLDFLVKLEDERTWEQEIPLVVELLLCGISDLELRNVYQGSVGKDTKQTEVQVAMLEVFDLMTKGGLLPDPLT